MREFYGANEKIRITLTSCADTLFSFIWDVADLLRGPCRPPEYRKVMLPMTVLRRLDCVLESTKAKVLEEQKKLKGQNATIIDKMLRRAAKQRFYNTAGSISPNSSPTPKAVQEAIDRLREYRSALITAAVTGKLELRAREKKMEALA